MTSIMDEFGKVAVERFKELKKMRPTGSQIPVVGFIPEAVSFLTLDLARKVKKGRRDFGEDHHEIFNKYWQNGLEPIVNGYYTASDAVAGKLDLVSTGTRSKMAVSIEQGKIKIANNRIKLGTAIDKQADKLTALGRKVYYTVAHAQGARFVIKGMMFNLGAEAVDAGIDALSDIGVDAISSNILDNFTNIGLDSIGNVFKAV
ncbi:MAG: hypothetical protein PHC64_00475 [Candidatus Gastranaerophilales bacterium]|nr:hypothetical protein [Candidatus Gastranaerophilales bacterium]